MSIERLYNDTHKFLEDCFHALEQSIDRPELGWVASSEVWRYRNQSLEAALIQKLAREVSGLGACLVLLEKGYVQELGVQLRVLDELREDIMFLSHPLLGDKRTDLHQEYLDNFYMEEFDSHGNAFQSEQKRPQVLRRKIHSANAQAFADLLNPSDAQELMRSISKAYGGFVHGASPQIMEMYGGEPPKYHLSGMLGTPRISESRESLWHYFHRAINASGFVAAALGDRKILERIYEFRQEFERQSGKDAQGDASKLISRIKSVDDSSDN